MIISGPATCEECRDGSCAKCKAFVRKQAAIARSVKRMVRETMAKCAPARLDADRTAKPKTRLVGHAKRGDCVGPGSVQPDALEDTATGKRTPLG
jgi:hypothetical protein